MSKNDGDKLMANGNLSGPPATSPAPRENERRLRAILDTAVDAIITIDERGIIESVNQATEQEFGYRADELIGSNISLLMPSPYREEHDRYLAAYLDTGKKKIIGIGREAEGQRKDGSTFPIDIAISEVLLDDRRLFTGIVRDISDKKTAEERALQSERLAAIGQMVAGLAHESRNAIQRAQACQEMLALDLQDQPDLLDLSVRTQQALDDLQRLYEEVRGYASPIKIEPEQCKLSELWATAWSNLKFAWAAKDVAFREERGNSDASCKVDRHRMEQVFRNILENALDACAEPVEIVVRCVEVELVDVPALRVALRDNGPGFTAEQAQGIFEPFFSTKKKGTGLGMAIAKRIVEAHRGLIEIGDVGSPGAEIVVTLPRDST